jgi:hypothetical protein
VSASAPLVVRARRALARPLVRRLLVSLLALATALVVASLVGSAEAARRRWGETRSVAVATRDRAVGDAVGPGAAEVRRLPAALVPPSALSSPPRAGVLVRQPIAAGEPLVPVRLAPHGLTGAAALVPAGHRAVAVPLAPVAAPPLVVGDLVDLVAVVAGGGAGFGGGAFGGGASGSDGVDVDAGADMGAGSGDPAFPLVEAAPVVAVGDDTVSVAVPSGDAPRVAYALTQGAVVITLAGA